MQKKKEKEKYANNTQGNNPADTQNCFSLFSKVFCLLRTICKGAYTSLGQIQLYWWEIEQNLQKLKGQIT